jgi:type II secretory pathway component PulK
MNALLTKRTNSKNGAALVLVIISLMVITIFSLIVVRIVYGNLTQAKAQEFELQAYYLSLSGTDLCMSALLQQGSGGANDTLLYINFNPAVNAPGTLTDTLTLDDGVVNLTVSAISKSGERWIVIQSAATLNGSAATRTTRLEFMYSNPLVQKKY